MPKSPLWECPPRTQAKLEILTQYLSAWFGILAAKGFQHVYYIDGFCGPGEYSSGEEGSPTIAAKLANSTAEKYPGFKATLIFIDENPEALKHLRTMPPIKKPHPNVSIDIKNGIFIDEIENITKTIKQHPNSPTFSFIDPFGFGYTPFEKLKLLMHNQRSEVFINAMCGFMNRFKEHPNKDVVAKIKGFLGQDELNEITNSKEDHIDKICEIFERKLKTIGQYTLKFMMRDEKHIRDNAFFFCGQNSKGFEKIKGAMWKIDPIHGNSFSAHKELNKDNSQMDFFGGFETQTHKLSKMIFDKFSGRLKVSIDEIFKWVIEETETFLPVHARSELEILYDNGMITSIIDTRNPSRKRRKNTWASHLLLTFADKT